MIRLIGLAISHLLAVAVGFAGGIYALPILTAPAAPSADAVTTAAADAVFSGEFVRELKGSDFFHWGEGTVSLSPEIITLAGAVAPGPDYRLYLSPQFVDDEAAFNALKARAIQVGEVKTFENFMVPITAPIDLTAYNTVVIWCESFGEFITAARYR